MTLSPTAQRRSVWLALLMTLVSIAVVQTGVSLSVPVIHEYGVLSTSNLRLCWASLVLVLIVRPPMHRYTWTQWRAAFILGAAMSTMTFGFFIAVQTLPQHLTVAIEFCGPLMVAAWGARQAWWALIWPLLAAVGIGLLLSGDMAQGGKIDLFGITFALVAAIGWGMYIIMMKRVGTVFKGLEGLTTSLVVAVVLTFPLALIETGGVFPPLQLGYTAGLAILIPLAPYVLEMGALRRLPASVFGILMSLEPAAGALAGWIILSQSMSFAQVVGVSLVICASLGVILQQSCRAS